jgi:hypothetical protein
MIGSIGSRLRLVLRQPDGSVVAIGGDAVEELPEVEFVAYAEDGRLSGRVRLDSSRLTDMLNTHDEFQLEQVLVERLTPDGGTMIIPEFLVRRDELLLVQANGPRGDKTRRIRTMARAITVHSGPYLVFGDVHTTPGLDPLLFFRRRQPMVPLTDAVIEYAGTTGPVREFADVVIVNRDLMDWVRRTDADATPAMTSGGLRRPTH